ncbi:dual specificity protein phosphatase 14-like [Artemia franciscana]|uniref:Protein-tyrosine-phosphatase n=1 Tax=Artemia franciscana TaxID=6661 RepID=A0AA88HWR3_ARTSF|nr:hypothetical protein QYM36_007388 [Artemia franciscana]KAK2717246.1 hypothetical protein QYM36_007388 [Artemia franciscana]
MTEIKSTSVFERIDEIMPGVFLSGGRAVKVASIRKFEITCVINTAVELPHLPIPCLQCIKIPLSDSVYVDIRRHFDYVLNKINEIVDNGGRVLVHCVAGASRSATFILAYLMKFHGLNLREAYIFVKSKRSIIQPNFGFFRQLIEFEREIFGLESVKFVYSESSRTFIPDVVESELKEQLSKYKRLGIASNIKHRYAGSITQPICSFYVSAPRPITHCRLSIFLLQEKVQTCS